MNYRFYFLVTFFIFNLTAQSQSFRISGKLLDSETNEPLEAATVYVETVKDSSLVTYTITDKDGSFELSGKTSASTVNLYISFVGYQAYERKMDLTKKEVWELSPIALETQKESLGDVVINAHRPPITIKKDTLEFNAASFNTKKDANVEDLLKELPGVEVDVDGNITVNGKPVNKILVNGKPFFGNDPTIATKNLTKEMVNKIQVSDTKSDSEAFTGDEGDHENKTINITIDKDKNKGVFGRAEAGGGTDHRFEYAGFFNYFNNDLRLSVLAGGNNINSPGFSFGEIQKMFGSVRYLSVSDNGSFNIDGKSFGGSQGITNSRIMGANYVDDWGKDTDFSTDYFYSGANSYQNEKRSRENILPEKRYFSNSNSHTESESDNYSVNMKFKTQIDSTFLIEDRPQFDYNKTKTGYSNDSETLDSDRDLTNSSSSSNNSDRIGKNFANFLNVNKKYGDNGAYVRLTLNNKINLTNTDRFLDSETQIFGESPQEIIRNQYTVGDLKRDELQTNLTWRLPLISKKFFLDLEYNYNDQNRKDREYVYDFNDASGEFSDFNTEQSTDFTNRNRESKPSVGLNYNNEDLRVEFDVGYVLRNLKSEDALRNFNFEDNFDAVEFNTNVSYQFSKKTFAYAGFGLRNQAPDIEQLSPYVDISNPLNMVVGNPDLKPSNDYNIYANFNNYDFRTRTGFFSYLSASFYKDRVVSRSNIDENLVRTTTYDNVDGAYRVYGNAKYSKKFELDTIRSLNVEGGLNLRTLRNVNFNNDVQYASRTITYGPRLGLRFVWKDLFELRPDYNLSFSQTNFNIDLFDTRQYLRHELRLRTTTFYPEKLEWNNDIRYIYNPDVAPGFQKSSLFWNTSLAYSILHEQGTVTFKVYDLLNQNTNSRRSASEDYIEDVQSTVLQQYFMLSFSYKFNTLGKKGETSKSNFFFD